MATGDRTQGRRLRVPDGGKITDVAFAEGDYCQDPATGVWYVRPPGSHLGVLDGHHVEEHEDGTITVSPSIWWVAEENGGRGWHGWLERGVWLEA